MIVGLLMQFGVLFIVLITGAYLLGKRSKDRITRIRIMVGALLVFFLAVMGFFGYLAVVLSRKQSGSDLPIRASFASYRQSL